MDSCGQPEMSLHVFTKLMFRIAHQWATHIDLDEYIELLGMIYDRITIRKVIRASDGIVIDCFPTIQVEVIPAPADGGEDPFAPSESLDDALWEACQSDEGENEGFEYKYEEVT